LRMTIFAARRVLPPDFDGAGRRVGAPHERHRAARGGRPPARCSYDERMLDRLVPAPEPPLKMTPSSRYQLRMPSIVSSTDRMKHALACCGTPCTPMLNHTGELKAARWLTRMYFSSLRNDAASSSSTK